MGNESREWAIINNNFMFSYSKLHISHELSQTVSCIRSTAATKFSTQDPADRQNTKLTKCLFVTEQSLALQKKKKKKRKTKKKTKTK